MISCAILERPGKWRPLVLAAGLLLAFAPLIPLAWVTDWTRSVHLEAFSILDKRVLAGVIENADASDDQPRLLMTAEQIEERLVSGYLMTGSGAWQHLWRKHEAAGFGQQKPCRRPLPTYKELVACLRPELLNRFRSDILFLPPLAHDDYNALLEEILVRLPAKFRPTMTAAAVSTLDAAVETQKGFRWVEELLSIAVRDVRRSRCDPPRVQAHALEDQGL